MRKQLVIILALVAIGGLIVGINASVTKTEASTEGIVMVGPCPADPTCPGNFEKNPKARVCHFDLGKPEGHINCQNEESIFSHIGASGHNRDYCAADTGGVCMDVPPPSPPPSPAP